MESKRGGSLQALSVLLLAATLGCGEEQSESLARSTQNILQGTLDTGDLIRHVVRVGGSGTICSGVLVTDRVVLTAAHCLRDYQVGCSTSEAYIAYEYAQPPPGFPGFQDWGVTISDPGQTNPTVGTYIPVQAVTAHGYIPRVEKECCQGSQCNLCSESWSSMNDGTNTNDIALVYLEEPVTGVQPVGVITAALSPGNTADPDEGIYSFDLPGLVGSTAVIAGTSNTGSGDGRAYGLADVDTHQYSSSNWRKDCDSSGTSWSETESCSQCMLVTGQPACVVQGDSGGPTFLNFTAAGGDAIAGLGSEALVAGVHSTTSLACNPRASQQDAGTWDSLAGHGTSIVLTMNGMWLRSRIGDFDGDQIADDGDNCPTVSNPDQENCNEVAEQAKGYPPVGDACDPIPCAVMRIDPVTTETISSLGQGQFQVITKSWVRDEFKVAPLSSRHFGNGSNLGDQREGLTTLTNVPTKYRFCQKDPSVTPQPVTCKEPADIDSGWVDALEELPGQGNPWHATSTQASPTGNPFPEENLPYESLFTSIADAPKFQRYWDFLSDSASWEASGMINPVAYTQDSGLDGRFWIHTADDSGTVTASSPTGYRVKTNGSTSADDVHLSNHYTDLDVDGWEVIDAVESDVVLYPWPYFEIFVLEPWIPLLDGVVGEANKVMPLPDNRVGAVLRTGQLVSIEGELDVRAGLVSLLHEATTETWASAIEPSPSWSESADPYGIQALVIAPDDPANIVEAVYRQGDAFGTLQDFGLAPLTLAGGPENRHAYVAVFSRHEERLFIVGGEDAAGAYLGEIWMRGVGGPFGWYQIPLDASFQPQRVLAATYSHNDKLLWVLDEAGSSARLHRVAPYLGYSELIHSWPRSAGWDRQWLEIDRDGQVILFSSSETQHGIARFSVEPVPGAGVEVASYELRTDNLLLQPSVDMQGYTLYHESPSGAIDVERLESLPGAPAALDALDSIL